MRIGNSDQIYILTSKLQDYTIFISAVLLTASTMSMAIYAYSPLPWWDYWEVVILDDNLENLFTRHNEHFILVPRIFYALDTVFASATGRFSLGAIWFFHIGVFLCMYFVLSEGMSAWRRITAFGITAAFMFSGRHLENLSWPFQVGFVGLAFVACTAIILTSMSSPANKKYAVMGAFAAGSAPLWSFHGLIVPLVCAIIAIISRKYVVAIINLSFLVAASTLYLVAPNGNSEPLFVNASLDIRKILTSYINQIGYGPAFPFLDGGNPPLLVAATLTVIVTIIPAALFVKSLTVSVRDPSRSSRLLSIFGIMLFSYGTLAAISLGRTSVDPVFEPAHRYFIYSAMLWAPALFLASSFLRPPLAKSMSVSIMLIFLMNQTLAYQYCRIWHKQRQAAALAIVADPANITVLHAVHPNPERLRKQVDTLKKANLSVFK
ncbi:hypothetical protein IGS74_02230 [Aureimonas sp. OT7]|uniref:hypothetical protein n=1 Tax=Aureimonas sp. OT7 TaxID=2816454 RepID=UPI0017849222|nr:hypothetical protein [Aureimonas sp. OT7]QOG07120.1 hypothetical protein IGS74_02230 [Aureimonas sp. OT7]